MKFAELIRFGRNPRAPHPAAVAIPEMAMEPVQQTTEQMAQKTLHVADCLKSLITIEDSISYNPPLQQYLGDFKKLATYFRMDGQRSKEGVALPQSMPAFANMMGALHRVFRSRFSMRLNVALDKQSLHPETQALLQEADDNLHAYRDAVQARFLREGVKSLPYNDFRDDPAIKKNCNGIRRTGDQAARF